MNKNYDELTMDASKSHVCSQKCNFAFFDTRDFRIHVLLWRRVRDSLFGFLFSTSGLDSTTTEIVMAVLKTLSRKNITM